MTDRRTLLALALLALPAGGGCGDRQSATTTPTTPAVAAAVESPPWFQDVTAASGVESTYHNGEEVQPPHLSILESLGGGVAVLDYDGDGKPDLYFPGGGQFTGSDNRTIAGRPGKLYRNLGGLRFADVTAEAGLATLAGGSPWFYSHAAAVGDFDRDGFPDLLVTGYGRVALFRNAPAADGGRRFEEVTERAGLAGKVKWATSAAFADFDGDGFPDLYVCQYVDWGWANNPSCSLDGKTPDTCSPKKFAGYPALLFRNRGDGTFEEVAARAGINRASDGADLSPVSKGLGVVAVDLDGDGRPEIYQANDTTPKFLYANRSTLGSLKFEEVGMRAGVAVDGGGGANGSMGADAGDPDGTGRPSLWVTNYENELHGLYKNFSAGGRLSFLFNTPASGIAAIGQKYVGWGTGFADFDRDGWEDLFASNGHAMTRPMNAARRQKAVLLWNSGGGRFRDVSRECGGPALAEPRLGRGAAAVDLDDDGRVDLVLAPMNDPAAVLRNVTPESAHWVGVRLIGRNNADVVGARVELSAGGRTQTRYAKAGGSYASSPDRRHVFGLGVLARADKLAVVWPDGTRQEWPDPPPGRYLTATQGEGALK